MSFGFSIGDFITVIRLATQIRKDFVEAPAQFQAISNEVRNLAFLIHDVEVDLSNRDLNTQQKLELAAILKSCCSTLKDIQDEMIQYRELDASHPTSQNMTKRAWKRLKWEPDDIRGFRSRIGNNVGLLNAFAGQFTRSDIRSLLQNQEDHEHQVILDWLSSVNYSTQQNDHKNQHQDGTGQWFLESPEFQAWVHGKIQTLFCPGAPGAGKTVLTSIVIDDLHNRYGHVGDIGIAYIYCNFQRYNEQIPENLMANILKQLLQKQQSMPIQVKTSLNEYKAKGKRPNFQELSQILRIVCGSRFSQIFIVIDALDECHISHNSRTRLLNGVADLQSTCSLNFMATARFIPEITELFRNKPSLEIRARTEDVVLYLQKHLSELPFFVSRNQKLQQEICTEITEAVDGMFLLAKLYLDSLKGKVSTKAIRSALKDFSSGLNTYDNAYENAMVRIESQLPDQRDLAKRILSWLSCAKRQITQLELQIALAVEPGETELDTDNLPDLATMVSVCVGLIRVDQNSNIICLVHYTIQEYFLRTWPTWFPQAHHEIARVCLSYLLFDCCAVGACATRSEFTLRLDQSPLSTYAAEFWAQHTREEKVEGNPTIQEMILRLLSSPPNLQFCLQVYFNIGCQGDGSDDSLKGPIRATGLHVSSYFGLKSIVLRLIESGEEIGIKDGSGRDPLFWAVAGQDDVVARLLLERGANPHTTDYYGTNILAVAAKAKNEEVIKHLEELGLIQDRSLGSCAVIRSMVSPSNRTDANT